jgi:hypothetical protein
VYAREPLGTGSPGCQARVGEYNQWLPLEMYVKRLPTRGNMVGLLFENCIVRVHLRATVVILT